MRFNIDAEEELRLVEEELQKIRERVNSRVTERGFVPYARPDMPDIVRAHTQCVVDGKRYKMNSQSIAHVPDEERIPLPPTDVSNIDQEVLGHLILYFTAEVSWLASELHDFRYEKDAAARLAKRMFSMVKIDLLGAVNPDTNKRMSDTLRRETAEQDRRFIIADEAAFRAKAEYQRAEAIFDGRRHIVEALNRARAGRSDEIRRTNHVPNTERELNDPHGQQERTASRRRRWQRGS